MAISETRQEKAAGATKLTEAEIKGKIIQFAWKLKKEGYAESTIKTYVGAIETLVRKGTIILDPEDVKDIIAKQNWSEKSKFNYVNFYDAFAKMMGIEWKKPKYRPAEKLPFIPLEKSIDQLIYGAGRKMGTLLQLIKETAMRVGEALQLQWCNIDSENNRIVLNNPEKGGSPANLQNVFGTNFKDHEVAQEIGESLWKCFETQLRSTIPTPQKTLG